MLHRSAPVTEVEPAPSSWGKLSSIGFLAGFLSGLTGAVGLVFNKFYSHYGLSRDQVIATRAANELLLLPHQAGAVPLAGAAHRACLAG